MNLSAYPRTIKDILTLNRKYIIPRYQREYAWEKPELDVFWKDILEQISTNGKELVTSDYFIGSLVLVGDDSKDSEFIVVDGQQRLTTITIFLSALTECFKSIDNSLSYSCYSYIEGKDDDFKPFFKLVNENPKPFLQRKIQNFEKENYKAVTDEEKKLLEAFEYFLKNLNSASLQDFFSDDIPQIDILKAIRDQLLKCKTIFITVENENVAQTIFETLNAKGKDLETLDLVKNKLFEILDEEHPSDFAKETWKQIKENLASREDYIGLTAFFRHMWISQYEFVTESRIYNSFLKNIVVSKASYKTFLSNLNEASLDYTKIVSPLQDDWNLQETKNIYDSLVALKTFRVVQPRPFILTLFWLYKNKLIKPLELSEYLSKIERFHFIFSAICSSRASGLESIYSKYSRSLRKQNDKLTVKSTINDLLSQLSLKTPTFEVYKENFIKLKYSNSYTKDKKLIQYIFKKIESNLQKTDELVINKITLEHIESQKIKHTWVHLIGNLLPLSRAINEEVGNAILKLKLQEFIKSELKQVVQFCDYYKTNEIWTEELSKDRAETLAQITYDKMKI